MENYSYNSSSYPDSGDSSPRSREIDFDTNTTPWDDQTQPQQQQLNSNYKVKFMCSYGGKIQPRPHDNQLSYIGGDTKILSVDRNIKFSSLISKLSALIGCSDPSDVSFKYQLPGEDLDALISVTNDDDLDHLMHEYDRLFRAPSKPARMRLFLFPVTPSSPAASVGSDSGRSDRDRFVEALNLGPARVDDPVLKSGSGGGAGAGGDDFLLGLDKGDVVVAPPPPVPVPAPVRVPELHGGFSGIDDQIIGPDPSNIQAQLQRLHLLDHEQQLLLQQQLQQQQLQHGLYRKSSDDDLIGGGYPGVTSGGSRVGVGVGVGGGDYFVQRLPEKLPPVNFPGTMPLPVSAPAGYWPDKQVAGGTFSAQVTSPPGPHDQPIYVVPASSGIYHQPPQMIRPVSSGQPNQGYYVQRVGSQKDAFGDQQGYNVVHPQSQQQPQPQPQPQLPAQVPVTMGPMGMVRTGGAGVTVTDSGYVPMGYDSGVGRQVYYTTAGGVVSQPYQGVGGVAVSGGVQPQYQGPGGIAVSGGEMRVSGVGAVGLLGQEGKVVTKPSQN